MSKVLVEVDTFTASIAVPEDGDDENALSVETPFQALANRTKNTKGRIDAWLGSAMRLIDVRAAVPDNTTEWFFNFQLGWYSSDNTKNLSIPLGADILPHGSTLTAVALRVDPGAARATSGNRMALKVYKQDVTGAVTQLGSTVRDAGTSTAQLITLSGLSEVVDRATYTYYATLTSGTDGGAHNADFCPGGTVTRTAVFGPV